MEFRMPFFSIRFFLFFLLLSSAVCRVRGGEPFSPDSVVLDRRLGSGAFRHAGTITGATVLSDGRRVLTCGRDGTARIWDIRTGKEIVRFVQEKKEDVWGAVVLPGEKGVLTAGENEKVTRWNMSGKKVREFTHSDTVLRIAVAADGKTFAACDYDGHCVLWDAESGTRIRDFQENKSGLYSVIFSHDQKKIIAGGGKGEIMCWNRKTGNRLYSFKRGTKDIFTICPAPKSKRFLVCCENKCVQIWDMETGKMFWEKGLPKSSRCAAWAGDEQRVAVTCDDRKLYILDPTDRQQDVCVELPGSTHWAAAYSADSREIFCACNNLLARFQASDGTRIFPATDSAVVLGGVWALAAVGGNETVYCANGSGKGIIARNATTGKILTCLLKKRFVSTLALSQDRNFLLAEDGKDNAVLVDVKNGKTIRSFYHGDNLYDVAFALEDKVLISADDKKIAVWDRETGKMLRTLDGHNHNINGLRVNPRGEVAAACCEKGLLCLWNIETGKLLVKLEAGGRDFRDCDFHPLDRRSVLVACDDGLRYWHAGGTDTAGLSQEHIRKRIRWLGHEDFKVRESATTDLIKAGQAVLPLIKRVDSEDPEVMMRIERIRKNLTGRKIYKGKDGKDDKDDKPALLEFKKPVSSVVFHPTGSWWAAVEGDGRADDTIVIGSIQDNKPVILRRIKSGQGPCSLHFSSDGTELFAGNRNSTVDVYSLKK